MSHRHTCPSAIGHPELTLEPLVAQFPASHLHRLTCGRTTGTHIKMHHPDFTSKPGSHFAGEMFVAVAFLPSQPEIAVQRDTGITGGTGCRQQRHRIGTTAERHSHRGSIRNAMTVIEPSYNVYYRTRHNPFKSGDATAGNASNIPEPASTGDRQRRNREATAKAAH